MLYNLRLFPTRDRSRNLHTGEMFNFVRVLTVSIFVTSVTRSSKNVRFVWKYRTDPCRDRNLEFTTTRMGSYVNHEFRLGSTSGLFSKRSDSSVRWNRQRPLVKDTELATELFFFRIQETLSQSVSEALETKHSTVVLRYVFDARQKRCSFFLRIGGKLFSVCTEGVLTHIGTWEQKLVKALEPYVRGRGIEEELKKNAKGLDDKWNERCYFLKATENNATDVYYFVYDRVSQTFFCSLSSHTPWYHDIFFGDTAARDDRTIYNAENDTYSTLGSLSRGHETRVVCNITFPDGMMALQEASVVTTTPAPPPLPTTTTTTTTMHDEPETVRPSEGADGAEVAVAPESSASSDSGSIVAIVVVMIVAIAILGSGAVAIRIKFCRRG